MQRHIHAKVQRRCSRSVHHVLPLLLTIVLLLWGGGAYAFGHPRIGNTSPITTRPSSSATTTTIRTPDGRRRIIVKTPSSSLSATPDDRDPVDDGDSTPRRRRRPEEDVAWRRVGPPIATLSSPWLTVLAERYDTRGDGTGTMVDYWRIRRADSVLVVILHRGRYVLPARRGFRPGLQRCTLDFVGGRRLQEEEESLVDAARRLLYKELSGLTLSDDDVEFVVLNGPSEGQPHDDEEEGGWPVDSSVSDQRLYGVVATIDDRVDLEARCSTEEGGGIALARYSDVDRLLADLPCLQCRAVLLEWLYRGQQQYKDEHDHHHHDDKGDTVHVE